MAYFLMLFLGALGGGICTFVALDSRRRHVEEQRRQQQAREGELELALQAAKLRERELESQVVTYAEWRGENEILKRDLANIDVNLRKLEVDRELQRETQEKLDQRSQNLAKRFLKDNIKWIGSSLNPNNFVNCKQRLLDVITWCREIGFDVSKEDEANWVADLKTEYERMVRAAFEREEQARIKAQIREDQKLQKELERAKEQAERERAAIQAALDKALAEAKDQHSAEIEDLRARLTEAEAKAQRAISQAQLTKAGHVYVISNIGSFGEGVFKIGSTRRLEPMDRVRELGDASVPFPFDVHMMVSSDDAPALENALHRQFHKLRLNKINPRKEFFRIDIEAILGVVEEQHGEVAYVADPEALQYRQSLAISDEDEEYIESVYEKLDDGSTVTEED